MKRDVCRVFIVDDHPVVRAGLRQMIELESDLSVCGEAGTARDAQISVSDVEVDIVLVDLSLRGASGLELVRNLRSLHPELPILVVSMHDEQLYAERALQAGARGYVMKDEATDEFISAIRQVLKGEIYLSHAMKNRLLNRMVSGGSTGAASPVESLTAREYEVFQMLGQGQGTRQIADELCLSVKTIESYRARLKEKLSLDSGNELVHFAVRWIQARQEID